MNEITLKIKYNVENPSRILEIIKNYNSIFGLTYNYIFDNKETKTKKIIDYIKTKSHIFLDTYFRNGAIYDSKTMIAKNKKKKIIFGGKKLFLQRQNQKIEKEEYKIKKLRPLQIVGASYNKGNCKFQILSEKEILFKPSKEEHFILHLENVGKNYEKKLKALLIAQNNCLLPITYKLSKDYIYISFDNFQIEEPKHIFKKKNDRIFSIDMNPNYIGWTIVDWKNSTKYEIIKAGIISLKDLNDYENSLNVSSDSKEKKYITNKRKYEVIQIAYQLVKMANHYRCKIFGMEDLIIKSSDKEKGKNFNRLCNNQWCRNTFVNVLEKLTSLYDIHLQKVVASYSSFEGNLIYRQERLPDMCLSAIEIGRRSYEFYHQYIAKDKEKEKNIVFDKLENVKSRVIQSLEELNYSITFNDLSDLYKQLKKMKCKYRFSIEDSIIYYQDSFFSKNHTKAFTKYYCFV